VGSGASLKPTANEPVPKQGTETNGGCGLQFGKQNMNREMSRHSFHFLFFYFLYNFKNIYVKI
jgi:hypothetical protein